MNFIIPTSPHWFYCAGDTTMMGRWCLTNTEAGNQNLPSRDRAGLKRQSNSQRRGLSVQIMLKNNQDNQSRRATHARADAYADAGFKPDRGTASRLQQEDSIYSGVQEIFDRREFVEDTHGDGK
jgi:hypothetical protein